MYEAEPAPVRPGTSGYLSKVERAAGKNMDQESPYEELVEELRPGAETLLDNSAYLNTTIIQGIRELSEKCGGAKHITQEDCDTFAATRHLPTPQSAMVRSLAEVIEERGSKLN
jgi:hypothetical protein